MIPLQGSIKLSQRELEVLKLLYEEKTSFEIAQNLNISQYTVEEHRKNLLKKTSSKSVVGLITFAMRNKII